MNKILKIFASGICGFMISAGAFINETGAVAVSTADIKTDINAIEVLSLDKGVDTNKKIQDWVFDGNQNNGVLNLNGSDVVQLDPPDASSADTIITQAKPAATKTKTPPPLPDSTISDKPGVKQKNLNNLVTSPDGNMYRVVKTSPWWKFWDSNRSIQKATPDEEGSMWNKQGEYVGEWTTVLKTKMASNLQVVKGEDGQDHLYTHNRRKVYRDGQYVTTFSNSILSDASLRRIQAGADDKVYAQYAKNSEDIIVVVDPATKKQEVAARVAAEVDIRTNFHSRRVRDSDGEYSHTEYYTTTHVDRDGVNKFSVDADGRVFTLFKGNVFEEGAHGNRKLLAGREGHWYTWNSPIEDVPTGNVRDFKIDTHGNLYSVQGGHVVVNNNKLSGLDLGWRQSLRVDDFGNVYKTNSRFLKGTYLIKTNVLPDPTNADRIAAPETVK